MSELDLDALRRLESCPRPRCDGGLVRVREWRENDSGLEPCSACEGTGLGSTVRAVIAALERGERDLDDAQQHIERAEAVTRTVKDENERLREALAHWNEHLPGCAKWYSTDEKVGQVWVRGEDLLDDKTECDCGYDGRWDLTGASS